MTPPTPQAPVPFLGRPSGRYVGLKADPQPALARTRAMRNLLLATFALLLAGCGPLSAQNPGGAYSPVNAVAEDGEAHLLLRGADVVAYFAEGAYRPGRAEFSSRHEGVTLRFASAEHKALFDRAPEKYLPQFSGYCANGIAYGIPLRKQAFFDWDDG